MKLIKRCLTLLAVAVLAVALIVLRPTADEFAAYYVSRNQTGLGGFFDEGLEAMVREQTEEDNYLFFSVFEVDGDERYVGILGHFFGRSTAEEAARAMEELAGQVKSGMETDSSETKAGE